MDGANILESVREEDYVEYFLFPAKQNIQTSNEEALLDHLKKECDRITKRYTNKYLWHKDSFQLNVRTTISNKLSNDNSRESLPPHLYGITHYGDNIEDEWFIVFLLQQVSKEVDDVIIRMIDSDGEFLLIEAADYLMPWANPNTCEKRVYLHKGNVHIIAPIESENADEIPEITVRQALSDLINNQNITRATTEIQNSIRSRTNAYPDKIQQSLHNVTIYVPVSVATLLKTKPQLISHAILAFCNRDPIDLRVCKAMKYFPPENRVYHRAMFTKCQYAMLTQSKYVPERMTGWNLPKSNDLHYKSHNLGVRIACGFEILVSQAKNSSNESELLDSKAWNLYLNSLKSKNYFDELLEHSKEYNNRLNKAQEYYLKHQESMHVMPPIGREILTLLSNVDTTSDEVTELERMPADDNDNWMDISPDALDQMLTERYGNVGKTVINGTTNGAVNLTEKLGEFLEHTSGIDGVEFPNEQKSKQADASVNFDADAFSCAVKNILNFAIPEDNWDLESESDMSDYGQEMDEPNLDMGPNPELMNYGELSTKMKEYMEQMDKELAKTTIGSSFHKIKATPEDKPDAFEDIETFEPVDIDVNALKNIMKSYKAQMGEAGPSSNMLGPMGVHFDGADLLNDDSD